MCCDNKFDLLGLYSDRLQIFEGSAFSVLVNARIDGRPAPVPEMNYDRFAEAWSKHRNFELIT
jgi:hypothetical protein